MMTIYAFEISQNEKWSHLCNKYEMNNYGNYDDPIAMSQSIHTANKLQIQTCIHKRNVPLKFQDTHWIIVVKSTCYFYVPIHPIPT
jgi:carbonic anhydrase